jgi:hypothetical protein
VIVAIFAIWVLRGVNDLRVQEQKAKGILSDDLEGWKYVVAAAQKVPEG